MTHAARFQPGPMPQLALVVVVALAALPGPVWAIAERKGLTPNQFEFATYMDALCPRLANVPADSAEVIQLQDTCRGLSDPAGLSDAQVVTALDALMPDELIGLGTTTLRLTSMQNGNLMERLNALRSGASGIDLAGLNVQVGNRTVAGTALDSLFEQTLGAVADRVLGGGASADDFGRWGLFANGNVKIGKKDKTSNEAGFDYTTMGVTTGIDYRLRENFVVGVGIGYTGVHSDYRYSHSQLDIDAWSGSLFGTYFIADKFYLDGMLTYGSNGYDSLREISYTDTFGPVDAIARGHTDGTQLSAGLSGGYDFNSGPWTFGPHAGTYYFDVDVDGFKEKNAGGLNLALSDQNAKSFQLNGGVHASVVYNASWGVLIPHARADYVHDFEDNPEVVGVRFANDPFATDPVAPTPPARLRGDNPDTDYVVWSIGTSAQFVNGVSGFVNYRTMAAFSDFSMYEFTLGLRVETAF